MRVSRRGQHCVTANGNSRGPDIVNSTAFGHIGASPPHYPSFAPIPAARIVPSMP
jgi:hypothetical protein